MKIKYNPVIDLFASMMVFCRWEQIRDMSSIYLMSKEMEEWYEETKKKLPGTLKNDLNYLVKEFLGLTFLPVGIVIKNKLTNVPDTLAFLRTIPPETLGKKLFDTYLTPENWQKIRNHPKKIRNALKKAGGTTRKNEPELFLEFISHPKPFWEKMLNAAEDFYSYAFQKNESQIGIKMQKMIREDQKILNAEPGRFFQTYCRTEVPSDALPEIFISYYDELDIIQIDDPDCLIYGWRRRSMVDTGTIPLEEAYSLLADEKRRTILQHLCQRSWFIREMAEELEITSATVSYHVSRLSGLNLVSYERGEKNRVYYQADRKRVELMMEAVKRNILGETDL